MTAAALHTRPLADDERGWLRERLQELWAAETVISRGHVHRASALSALVCVRAGEIVGLATYALRDEQCELVTLDAFTEGMGAGSALLEAVVAEARRLGCRRLWLVTSNDNLHALGFYQRRGLRLVAVHPGAVDAARKLKPAIPTVGLDRIPLHDELELELILR